MNKKVISLLLAIVMVFGMMVTAVPAHAAKANEFTIVPNKAEVNPGDEITYQVVFGPMENIAMAQFTLVIPDGLTFVTGAATEGMKATVGADEFGFTPSTLTFTWGGVNAYKNEGDLVVMSFTCTAEELGEYEIEIMDDYVFATDAYDDLPMSFNTAASKVKVVVKPIPATGVSLNKTALTLKEGANETLVATVAPADSTDKVEWSTSNNKIATVDANGKVTAVAKGSATITVKAGAFTATCAVTVECAHKDTTAHAAVESTCKVQGNVAYTTCNKCNAVISGSDAKLPLDEDNHVNTKNVAAETGSCVEDGHGAYTFCNDCNSVVSGSDAPVAGPHGTHIEKVEEKYLKTAADCDDAAVYYKSCELCGEAFKDETFTYGDPLGHKMADATCDTPKTCSVCGKTEGEKLGHNWAGVAWSKNADGHWHDCSRCGADDKVAAHDFGDAGDKCVVCEFERNHVHRLTAVAAVAKTCTTDGSKAYYTCSGCADWFEDEAGTVKIADKASVVIPAGHDWKDATCEAPKTCPTCGTTEGEKSGHDWADATCDAPKTCKRCEETDGEALGHKEVVDKAVAPTCTKTGLTEGKHCDRCKEVLVKQETVAALGHTWDKGVVTKEATEQEAGVKTYTCTVCSATKTEEIPKLKHEHTYTSMITQPTCTEKGYITYTCSSCGDTYEEVRSQALGHSEVVDAGYAATCTKDGLTDGKHCDRCDAVLVKQEVIAATGHDYKDGICGSCGAIEPATKVDAPEILSCYSKVQTAVKTTWTLVEDADGYELWRSTTPEKADSWVRVKTIADGAMDRYTNQGLEEGVTYYYKVRAYAEDAAGNRTYSDFSAVSYMPATVVWDGPYSNATFRIRLRWKEITGAHGYQIWRLNEDETWSIVKTLGDKGNTLTDNQGATTAYSNTGLEAGENYTYKIRAFMITEDGRKVFGAYSDEFTVAAMPETPVVVATSPAAARAKLSWEAVNGAAGYQVWMLSDGNWSIVKSLTDGSTAYTKYDLQSGTEYQFKVRAYTEVNGKKTFGAYSEIASVTVK